MLNAHSFWEAVRILFFRGEGERGNMLLRLVSPPISGVLYSTDGCCLGKALLRVQIRLEFKFETVDNTIQSVLHLEHSSSH